MDISSIVKLVKDINQDNLYNFFVINYDFGKEIRLNTFKVRSEHVMRIDLIMEEIYQSNVDEDIDIFCELNGIDNPLNIMEGDILYFCGLDEISQFGVSAIDGEYYGSSVNLANPNKLKKSDSKRSDYVNNNFSLNPNYNNGAPNVTVSQNKVTIRKT